MKIMNSSTLTRTLSNNSLDTQTADTLTNDNNKTLSSAEMNDAPQKLNDYMAQIPEDERFRLNDNFVHTYSQKPVPFGFGIVGDITYQRTYARVKNWATGEREQWIDTVRRVVEGVFYMQQGHALRFGLPWDEAERNARAEKMFDKIFNIRFLPPGRGLWSMGTDIVEKKGLFASLNNCAFISTEDMHTMDSPADPFCFLMDMSMLGVGVGFDTEGAKLNVPLYQPEALREVEHVVHDSREGWVDSVRKLLDSYFCESSPTIVFDYTKIRPKGEPLKTFGGVSSGPEPLRKLHNQIREVLDKAAYEQYPRAFVNERVIVDIMNMIGCCVVSGNIRRSAELALGHYKSRIFRELKDYGKHPERMNYGYASNNSVMYPEFPRDMDPEELHQSHILTEEGVCNNGEPGELYLKNAQAYGRMIDPPNYRDWRARGVNPCGEQTLESAELCCLVETFPSKHDSLKEYLETLDLAFEYAKTVTLGDCHWSRTDKVMKRNRRIGTSMSGVTDFIGTHGKVELIKWCDSGFKYLKNVDKELSKRWGIPESVKITSIKPSGTVSLVAGVSPGVHYPQARYYIRRIRFADQSEMLEPLRKAGYHMERDKFSANTIVVEFPVDAGAHVVKTQNEASIEEKFEIQLIMQRYWADNQVSATITFHKEKERHKIPELLGKHCHEIKSVSFLPIDDTGYEQAPYETISADAFAQKMQTIKPVDWTTKENVVVEYEDEQDGYCDSDKCIFPRGKKQN